MMIAVFNPEDLHRLLLDYKALLIQGNGHNYFILILAFTTSVVLDQSGSSAVPGANCCEDAAPVIKILQ